METKNKNVITLNDFKDKHYGKVGTTKRDELEDGYENFKIGALILEARKEKGLTQEQLAKKIKTKKPALSRIENHAEDIKLSTLEKIVQALD